MRGTPGRLRDRLMIGAASLVGPLWVGYRRYGYRLRGRPLTDDECGRLTGFFEPATLAAVRVAFVPAIRDPIIFRLLRALRIADPTSLELMAGMALVDTVVVAGGHRLASGDITVLLFHELVHVVQFRVLGTRGMLRRYVAGWVGCGHRYRSIPLEVDAYELHGRFAAGCGVFSVEAEVRKRLGVDDVRTRPPVSSHPRPGVRG